ncbi:type II toxin-antitoxin system VapC family toxin [Nostoc sp. NIES-2111]
MSGRYYLLDTNVASHIIKASSRQIENRLTRIAESRLAISAITEAELRYGLDKMPDPRRLRSLVEDFLGRTRSLPWDTPAAQEYARLRILLERQCKRMDSEDLMIAAHALSIDAVLVSQDKVFQRVPNLRLEDWTKA